MFLWKQRKKCALASLAMWVQQTVGFRILNESEARKVTSLHVSVYVHVRHPFVFPFVGVKRCENFVATMICWFQQFFCGCSADVAHHTGLLLMFARSEQKAGASLRHGR